MTLTRTVRCLLAIALAASFATLALAPPVEKTIAVPERDQDVKIGYSAEGATIESVRIQNYPDEDQVEKAKSQDPSDKSFIFWNFSVGNPSARAVKMKMDVTLMGKDGKSVGRADRSDTVEAGKTDDNIRVMMHPKILDLVNAKSVLLKLTIEPKEK